MAGNGITWGVATTLLETADFRAANTASTVVTSNAPIFVIGTVNGREVRFPIRDIEAVTHDGAACVHVKF